VVHVLEKDDLRSALGKILKVCNYPKVLKRGEPIGLQGDVAFRITGDWIVMLPESRADNRPGVIVINLIHNRTSNTPRMIKDYLRSLDVSIIDYPSANDDASEEMDQVEILEAGKNSSSLVRTILNHTVRSFRSHVQIPVYQSEKAEFRFTINADFFLKIKERDAIIDLTGLAPEMISFLEEHHFLVLSLAAEKEPLAVVEKTLEFLDVQFARGPHSFMATSRDDSRNIRFSLPGIVFSEPQGKAILATPLTLPDEIAAFLSKKGYKILSCRFSESL
jgi:hypothetical protein